jgi:3-oxoadipate enol-lactonase
MSTTRPAASALRERRIPTAVGELAVLDSGESQRPAIVFRHGIFLDRALWLPIAERLVETHRVIVVEAPGHGASTDPGRAYTLTDDAHAGVELLDALGIDRAVFVGHSWGGMWALRIALTAPERVAALALVNTPLAPRPASGRRQYRALAALLRLIGAPRWYGRQIVAALFDPAARDSAVAHRLIEQVRVADRAVVVRAMRAVLIDPDDVSDRLAELRMPVLALAGADDYVLDPEAATMLAARVPHARIVHVPGDHVAPVEQPAAVEAELRRLLAEA